MGEGAAVMVVGVRLEGGHQPPQAPARWHDDHGRGMMIMVKGILQQSWKRAGPHQERREGDARGAGGHGEVPRGRRPIYKADMLPEMEQGFCRDHGGEAGRAGQGSAAPWRQGSVMGRVKEAMGASGFGVEHEGDGIRQRQCGFWKGTCRRA